MRQHNQFKIVSETEMEAYVKKSTIHPGNVARRNASWRRSLRIVSQDPNRTAETKPTTDRNLVTKRAPAIWSAGRMARIGDRRRGASQVSQPHGNLCEIRILCNSHGELKTYTIGCSRALKILCGRFWKRGEGRWAVWAVGWRRRRSCLVTWVKAIGCTVVTAGWRWPPPARVEGGQRLGRILADPISKDRKDQQQILKLPTWSVFYDFFFNFFPEDGRNNEGGRIS